MISAAIFTNLFFSTALLIANGYITIRILQTVSNPDNQKTMTILTYSFLAKIGSLIIGMLASGASPFFILGLLVLDVSEFAFLTKNLKQKLIKN